MNNCKSCNNLRRKLKELEEKYKGLNGLAGECEEHNSELITENDKLEARVAALLRETELLQKLADAKDEIRNLYAERYDLYAKLVVC